jgi:hypothetical protein
VWLRVHHELCSKTMRGTYIANLPVSTDFELWGRPVLETEELELAARHARSSLGGLAEAGFDVGGAGFDVSGAGFDVGGGAAESAVAAVADRIDGRLCVDSSSERGYFGRFSLSRDHAIGCDDMQQQEQCDAAADAGCEVGLSREEVAKRAWLSRLDVPAWGDAHRGDVR